MIQQASMQLPGSSAPHTHQEQPVLLNTADAVAGDSALPANSVPRFTQEYAELRQLVIEKHLLDKQPAYYTFKILLNFGLLGLGGTMLVLLRDSWFQLLNAAYLAFVFTQMGFIVHDAGHQQILRNGWKNDLIGILHANLLLGFSYIRWVVPHNMHHSKPNQLGADPDMGFRVFAFTAVQASQKRGLLRWIAKYQAYFFFPFLSLEAVNLKGNHIRFLLRNQSRYRAAELVCLALHLVLYFGFILHYLSFGHALLFMAVHQAIFGLYLGMVISPNHFGMPVLGKNPSIDFLSQQVLTARNVRRHRWTDYCYGPLRSQIEHHLFPNMPLNRLREAQKIVQPYCEAHGIAYHETGVMESYREILHYMHKVGAALRQTREDRECRMATQEQIALSYNYLDEIFRITYGEHGDYSGAMYDGDFSKTLQQAQEAKHEYILHSLNIGPGKRILDIGCGWGPVLRAAHDRGANGVGLTLSTKQAEACRRNGLDVRVKDWKDISVETFGKFDGIVSVGSFEHFCSREEFLGGRQEQIYGQFMKLCHELLPVGGRLYLQTMTWGKNAPRPEDISLQARKESNEYVVAVLEKFYPGSWLPTGEEQIVRCAIPYLNLVSIKNGRLDYIETMTQWSRMIRRFSFPKLYIAVKTLRYFFIDPDFSYKLQSSIKGYNRQCFQREIMDHQRMIFEKV